MYDMVPRLGSVDELCTSILEILRMMLLPEMEASVGCVLRFGLERIEVASRNS
jgi:hypothetical protein